MFCVLVAAVSAAAQMPGSPKTSAARSRVVIVHDPAATEAFKPIPGAVREMAKRGLTTFTGKSSAASAWQSLIAPKEIVGIKVFSSPGPNAGTRPALVGALIESLLEARFPRTNIIIWDKHQADLRRAGFSELGAQYGVQVQGSADSGYDEELFYSPDRPILGQLVWGDVEFGRKGEGIGRRSFLSKLLTKRITKIISVTPLLNHNSAGVSGHLYSLAMGSVDNTIRFENDILRLSTAVPEIYALPELGDRVVLNITDALICQYQGEQRGLLHYSTTLNELRFSNDPVALDFLSLRELDRTRLASNIPIPRDQSFTNQMELLGNASLLELGVSELENINVERVR
jgi:hypothetical protein